MSKTIAFIGAGNMGSAIIRATCRVVDPREVAIYDVLPEKADALAAETGCVAAGSGAEALDGAAYVMLCVKPQYYADTLRGLLPALKKKCRRRRQADAGLHCHRREDADHCRAAGRGRSGSAHHPHHAQYPRFHWKGRHAADP